MKTYRVKSWPEQFAEIADGRPFDVRKNDRGYAAGDVVEFQEFDDRKGTFTGRKLKRRITHTLEGLPGGIPPLHGVQRGYSVLGLEEGKS